MEMDYPVTELHVRKIFGMLGPMHFPEWHAPAAAPPIAASRRTKATFIPAEEEVLAR
jgi:hypothetical protein